MPKAMHSSTDLPNPTTHRGFVYAVCASRIALRSLPKSWNLAATAMALLKSPATNAACTIDNLVSMITPVVYILAGDEEKLIGTNPNTP